jgi:protease-4
MRKWLAIAIVLALACKDEEPSASPPGSGAAPASPFGALAGGLDQPGPYEEPKKSADFSAEAEHFVVLDLEGSLDELESISLFAGAVGKPLREVTNTIAKAAADAKVKGLVVRVHALELDLALAEELRRSLLAFKAAGKPVACHTESIANAGYIVLTACDRIGLAPLGTVAITGAAATPIHVKGLLDTLGVQAQFLHVGAYKGAAEPLTRDAPSEQMLETLQAIVDGGHGTLVASIVEGRKLSREEAIAAVDEAIFVDDAAVKAKLVDAITPWHAFLDQATDGKPWTRAGQRSEGGMMTQMLALQRFLGMLPAERPEGPHVALVYAVGNVIDGKGSGIVGARQEIASRTLVAALDALARDDNTKAVVLRVSSPGGSALASEQIWYAVARLGERKPVIVSMGAVAASGGYFIAAGAKKIFAEQTTLTGSIGVVGGKLVLGPALDRVGVKAYEVHKGERALLWSSLQPWTESETAAVQKLMETTYERFLEHVAAGRGKDRDAVHEIAQGRVWTGADARERGLVDAIGGLDDAIAEARKLGDVPADAKLEVYPGDPTLRDIVASFGVVQSPAIGTMLAALDPQVAAEAQRWIDLVFALRDAHLWAVAFVKPL